MSIWLDAIFTNQFSIETIVYGVLDPAERYATKAYFDAVGHYTRWDFLRMEIKKGPCALIRAIKFTILDQRAV